MIANVVTDEKGLPKENQGKKISESSYIMPANVRKFFLKFQKDYINAWTLQRKPMDEFDGLSLLERTKTDQETFAAFVGVEFLPQHKRWRWRGRKNTARNKLIGILAHMIAGMLFPFVYAQNERDEEDKGHARVMYILVEEWLKKANYEIKFMYMALSALVLPAVIVDVDYSVQLQKIKQRRKDGSIDIKTAINEAMSGLFLHILSMDEILFSDYYAGTGNVSNQPQIFRVRRIPYDQARSIYSGKYFMDGKDLFDYVEAGTTRWIAGDENNTLFDVEWNEADGNFVQVVTGYYLSEDLEVTFVGGIPMCNYDDIYNSNPFEHRRMVYTQDEWLSVPVYKFAMSGFEPLDPAGRFLFYKSGAFKEYWEDRKITEIDRLLIDGIKLDVMKPTFISGAAQFDSRVVVPGAAIAMPQGASATQYSLSPNLAAAAKAISDGQQDMSESTQDKVMSGITQKGVTATQTIEAKQQARIFLGVFGLMLADLVRKIGELAMDDVIQYATVGELDATIPESLKMKYKIITSKGKEKGKDVTNKVVFSNRWTGKEPSKEEIERRSWKLFEENGGQNSTMRVYELDPYRFSRTRYTMFVDADRIIMRSMGMDRQEKDLAFERLMDPRVLPFINPEAVVQDYRIEEYTDGDPDKYKAKQGQEEMIRNLMGMIGGKKVEEEPVV